MACMGVLLLTAGEAGVNILRYFEQRDLQGDVYWRQPTQCLAWASSLLLKVACKQMACMWHPGAPCRGAGQM